MFSFNAPYGACENCKGLGHLLKVDPELVAPDMSLSVAEGAIVPIASSGEGTYYVQMVESVLKDHGYDSDVPLKDMSEEAVHDILYGTGDRVIEFHYESKYGGVRKYKAPFEGMIGTWKDVIKKPTQIT